MIRVPIPVLAVALLLGAFVASEPGTGAPADPSAREQLGVYEINRARHDPPAYGDEIGVDLSDVAPQPPLAVNGHLTASARFHSEEMLEHDYFAHVSQVTGDGPNKMAADEGYDLFGRGLDYGWTSENWIESLAYGWNLISTWPEAIALLIEDEGVPSLGHRVHLLAMSSFFEQHREIGCGRAASGGKRYYTIHTGYRDSDHRFVTGVVYEDVNENGRYDLGEGLDGVTVRAGSRSTTTMSAGGYAIRVDPGSYTVTCAGGSFTGTATSSITVGTRNVEVDFRTGRSAGDVDFVAGVEPDPPDDPDDPDDPPATLFALTKGKGKLKGDPVRWTLKLKGDWNPGLAGYEGDGSDLVVRIGGVDFFTAADLETASVKLSEDDATGSIRKIKVRLADGSKLTLDLEDRRFKIKIKGESALDLTTGSVTTVVGLAGTEAVLTTDVTIGGSSLNKAVFTPAEGAIALP